MAFARNGIGRDLGAAFAVLAIYVLTLLLPLHQAAGLQRDLGKLGFEAIDGWSICAPLAETGGDDAPAAVKCPATGIAKTGFAGILPASITLAPPTAHQPAAYAQAVDVARSTLPAHFAQSRAPPSLV